MREQIHKVWNRNPLAFTCFLTVIILFYPTGFVHEVGHLAAGYFSNTSCKLIIDWSLQANCKTIPEPILLYFSLGGILGMIISLSLFVLPNVRNNKGILVGVSTIAFDHFLKAIFETFAHSAYITNFIFQMLMGVLVALFMIIMLRYFIQHEKNKRLFY